MAGTWTDDRARAATVFESEAGGGRTGPITPGRVIVVSSARFTPVVRKFALPRRNLALISELTWPSMPRRRTSDPPRRAEGAK